MDKYIFLDIDGVLATDETLGNLGYGQQLLLGKILSKTDAKIIISSSWRFNDIAKTIEFFNERGFMYCDKIISITIRAKHYINSGIHLGIPRGVEIKQWLDTHIHSNNGKNWYKKLLAVDFNYVILDDNSDMLLEQKDQFVQVNSNTGLTMLNVKKAIKILNKI